MFHRLVDFRVPKLIFVMTLIFYCVGCDQITKTAARDSLARTAPHSYFSGLTALTLVVVGLALYLRENRAWVLVGGAKAPQPPSSTSTPALVESASPVY